MSALIGRAPAVLTALVLPWMASLTSAAGVFQLRSEVWTNMAGGNGAVILSLYRYDAQGKRVAKEVRPSPDTSGPVLARTTYVYDAGGRPVKTVLRNASDTVSWVEYAYAAGGDLMVTRTWDSSATLRFADTLIYDRDGRLRENRRLVGGKPTQIHRFTYDARDRVVSDTLLEWQDSAMVPAQVVLTAYRPDGLVASEGHFRAVSGAWYQIKTVKKGYLQGSLTQTAAYERDGKDTKLMDSIAYAYDSHGNRIKESGFDEDRQATYTFEYEWQAIGPGAVRGRGDHARAIVISLRPGGLHIAATGNGPLLLNIRDARGLLTAREIFPPNRSGNTVEYVWPASLPRGVYFVEAVEGNSRRAIPVIRP